MTKHTVDRAQLAVAVHEAAHAVVGRVMGLSVARAVIHPADEHGHAGRCEFSRAPLGTPDVVDLAGTVAELRFQRGPRFSSFEVIDRLSVHRDDRRALTASGDPGTLDRTRRLIETTWSPIRELAARLYGYREISGEQVDAALKLSEYNDESTMQLAAIRSGRWPAARPIVPGGGELWRLHQG
ncbi:hypothetical protein [Gordonia sp. NB41Y]|uniref:hypothetical protein n=1 Tax=Gordonia sp. NB41Y TaxID=875808 RepID=UPI00034B4036|nr:hypothetical protein [Gordonia sp. NB41Y]KOY49362.1 hypothetical protein ISGA_10755 [Gordonia sp. NB41Y]WLP90509.1 hypothetical protein Q9K23_23925 [Gordonia sp. NB41Y]